MELGKICKDCKIQKPLCEFETFSVKNKHKNKEGYEYRRYDCKQCRSIKSASSRYKITFDEVKKLKETENCEICNINLKWSDRYIDHNHTNGKVRGILCPRCNSTLELFEQSKHLIEPSLNYLKKYEPILITDSKFAIEYEKNYQLLNKTTL